MEWKRTKTTPENVNNGEEFVGTDGVYFDDMNAAFNNAFYAVDFAEALARQPDNTEAGKVGTPTASIITDSDGKPKFKFANLKGEQGKQGEQGEQGEQGKQGEQGEQGEQGKQGEQGADGLPALAYSMSANITTDVPTGEASFPNQYFNRTPQLNDIFIAVGASSVGSYEIVYKITSVGSPQSVATVQSYVTTTGKQLAGGAALDGNNVFTGNNTFQGETSFEKAPKSATYESATGTAMLHDTGTEVKVGQTTRSLLLRGNGTRPKYSTNEENSEHTKDVALLDDTTSASTVNAILKAVYPVGSIYMSMSSANPSTWISGTTWEAWGSGKVPIGVDTSDNDFSAAGNTGGEKTHVLTESEMPEHAHTGTNKTISWYNKTGSGLITKVPKTSITADYTVVEDEEVSSYGTPIRQAPLVTLTDNYGIPKGGDAEHNNMPPYVVCYMWRRTA